MAASKCILVAFFLLAAALHPSQAMRLQVAKPESAVAADQEASEQTAASSSNNAGVAQPSTLPGFPGIPRLPQLPQLAGLPTLPPFPGLPPLPHLPPLPPLPQLPPLPTLPGFPRLPPSQGIPALPQLPTLPGLPQLPTLPGFPRLPPLPGSPPLPPAQGIPGLPQLPSLPGLPQLPPLPGLPQLPPLPGFPGTPHVPIDQSALARTPSPTSPSSLEPTECLSSLMTMMPCMDYLTSTSVAAPPSTCCAGFKSLIDTAPICMCHGMNGDINSFTPAPIDFMRMMSLPITCGVTLPLQTIAKCSTGLVPPLMPAAPTTAAAPSPVPSP